MKAILLFLLFPLTAVITLTSRNPGDEPIQLFPTCHAFSPISNRLEKSTKIAPLPFFPTSTTTVKSSHEPYSSSRRITTRVSVLFSTSSSDEKKKAAQVQDEIIRLRESASRLRREAEALEAQKQQRDGGPSSSSSFPSSRDGGAGISVAKTSRETVYYFDLNNSCWEITYRFADEPEPRDTDKNPTTPKRKFYSGKLLLKFKSDGYTDVIVTDGNIRKDISKGDNNNNLIFQKVWGWDREKSNTDNLEYLLFSADVIVPRPTSNSENIATDIVGNIAERFYFQARVEKDETKNDAITLRDGSVTVKRSIQAPSIGGNAVGGWWGLFRGANQILAEFRLVGEFRCRGVKLD